MVDDVSAATVARPVPKQCACRRGRKAGQGHSRLVSQRQACLTPHLPPFSVMGQCPKNASVSARQAAVPSDDPPQDGLAHCSERRGEHTSAGKSVAGVRTACHPATSCEHLATPLVAHSVRSVARAILSGQRSSQGKRSGILRIRKRVRAAPVASASPRRPCTALPIPGPNSPRSLLPTGSSGVCRRNRQLRLKGDDEQIPRIGLFA